MMKILLFFISVCLYSLNSVGQRQTQVVDSTMRHLRNGDAREWFEFPVESKNRELKIEFLFKGKVTEGTLSLRQYDVKQNWDVLLNGKKIGSLVADEGDMTVYFSIPSGTLRKGRNELLIKCNSESVDDIMVGQVSLDILSMKSILSETSLELAVVDGKSSRTLPCRITIVNDDGSLQTVLPFKKENLAVRPGVVYTSDGNATIGLPAGGYKVYATRGFEYGVDSAEIYLKPGDRIQKTLRIQREVDTEGWVSSDTHIHTFTHSRHGDATMEERAITIAGEGIELPIMTDHNTYVDLAPFAEVMGVNKFFTSVVGDELTTKFGHFNVFKARPGTPVINHNINDWDGVSKNINDETNSKVIILNHARDVHNGFRPFGPDHHLSSAGTTIDMEKFPANAMEVINSGSQQTNIMNLFHDWFGMVNRGHFLTPVGSSDSHDVSRYIVGQGRTYIKSNDNEPGKIDVDSAIHNFKGNKVMVSLGLMSKIKVNGVYGPGDLVPVSDTIAVGVEVWGPSWAKADYVSLYANGKKIMGDSISDEGKAGLKWAKKWKIPAPGHDVFLTVIAEGPGRGMPFWPIAKPYQPASPNWVPRLIAATGPVWIDADKNDVRNSAFYYATEAMDASEGSMEKLIKILQAHDRAVAVQVAMLLWIHGRNLESPEIVTALKAASPETREGFDQLIEEVRLLSQMK